MKPRFAACSIASPARFPAWVLLSAVLGFAATAAAQNALNVAVVDVGKIFKNSNKAKDFDAKIDEARYSYAAELDARMQDHHRLREELARIDKDLDTAALPAETRADRRTQREQNVEQTAKMEHDITDFRADRERGIQEQALRERTQLVEDIITVVNAQVASKHYDLILNKSGRGAGGRTMVLYSSDTLDITDAVLAALNQDHPARKVQPPGDR